MTDKSTEEPLSVDSDISFVILSNGSLPPSLVKEKNINEEPSLTTNNNSSTNSNKLNNIEILKSSFFNGHNNFDSEAQDMINQLMHENLQLKETLSQNNLAIKSHLNNFFLRQQEMLKAQETHKQKFSEMKELILKLKAENSDLKKQLECYFLQTAIEKTTDGNLINDTMKKTEATNQNMDVLLKEEQEKNKKLEILKENLSLKNVELQTAVNNLEKEILKLNEKLSDIERLHQLNSTESKTPKDSFLTFSLPNTEARAQINNLLLQLEEEKAKNLKLKQELEKEKTNNLIVSQNKSTAEELLQCLTKLEEMSVSLEKQTEKFNSFNSWITFTESNPNISGINKKNVDSEFEQEVNKLKSQLSNEQSLSQQNYVNLEKMKTQYSKLLDNYKALQEQIKGFESASKNVDKFQEKIECLTHLLEGKNQELEEKNILCHDLKEEILSLKLKCEDICALQFQADQYKNDFEEERKARENLAGEKEAMAEQIRLLHTRIEKIENDKSQSSDSSKSPKKTLDSPKKARYVCPKCMFAFTDLRMCEEHVEDCINTLFYP